MAEVISTVANRLESILQCAICLEIFKEPRILYCGHVFCDHCMHQLVVRNSRMVKCPTCQKQCNVSHAPKVFILKDVVETQKSISTSSSPLDICELCDQSCKIDNLWSCGGCDAKSVCSKCMVTNSHGKCESVPRTLANMLEEKKELLEQWRRTVCDNQMNQLTLAVNVFSDRIENMRERVTSLRGLLRGDLLARNGDSIFDRSSAELASLQNACKAIMDKTDGRPLGIRLATINDDVKKQEERMKELMANLEVYTNKFDQCSLALNVFTTSIRNILEGVTTTAEQQPIASAVSNAPAATAEEIISELGIGANDEDVFNRSTSNDEVHLILLDIEEPNSGSDDQVSE